MLLANLKLEVIGIVCLEIEWLIMRNFESFLFCLTDQTNGPSRRGGRGPRSYTNPKFG